MLRYIYFVLFALLSVYVIVRTLKWFETCGEGFKTKKFKILYASVMGLLGILPIIAFHVQKSGTQRWIMFLSAHWFGILFYIVFYVAMADLGWLILRIIRKAPKGQVIRQNFIFRSGLVVLALIVATSIYGFIHLRNMQTKEYEITINKEVEKRNNLRVALIADTHMGYTIGVKDIQKMAEKINEADVDIVCFAGDVFNNNFDALDDQDGIMEAFKSIKSTYGIYACWGNHDVAEPLFSGFSVDKRSEALRDPRMDEFLIEAGFVLLEDKEMLIDDEFYVIGRLDYEKAGDGTSNRKSIGELTKNMDKSKPIVLIDHQPREFDEIAAAGVDLDLSGHTHAGQIFPMNITDNFIWENDYGLLQVDNMTSVVTSGIGVYGPAMRTFTNSEVVVIDVSFK